MCLKRQVKKELPLIKMYNKLQHTSIYTIPYYYGTVMQYLIVIYKLSIMILDILGASTAAKILGVAGGLSKLSKMPACNVLPLGQQKKTLAGFSQAAALPHTGFIYFSQIVQDTTPVSNYNCYKF